MTAASKTINLSAGWNNSCW